MNYAPKNPTGSRVASRPSHGRHRTPRVLSKSTHTSFESCAQTPPYDYYHTEVSPIPHLISPPLSPTPYSSLPAVSPDIYSTSGLDVMGILLRVFSRPHPQVHLGPIDCSCAFLICDLDLPDTPIIYASEAFTLLAGYSSAEVLGRNPRFMQVSPRHESWDRGMEGEVAVMRAAVKGNTEVQLRVRNYKRSGKAFDNLLSIIPVRSEDGTYRYSVGFQAEVK